MKFKRLNKYAFPPLSPKDGNNGYDLTCFGDYILPPNHITEISTQLAFEIPEGYAGIILGRSGLAAKNHIECWHNGLIDSNYRGEIKLLLKNHGYTDMKLDHGDRVAQLVIVKTYTDALEEVDELSSTVRNDKGFGSSGLKSVNQVNEYYLVFDGGNGGVSSGLGYGSYIIRAYNRHGDIVINNQLDYSDYGTMTNNDAEYHTLHRALTHLRMNLIESKRDLKDIIVHIEGDSELVRNQIGRLNKSGWDGWKCNLLRLKNYRDEIRALLTEFKSFIYEHVSREYIVSVLGH